MSTSPTFSGAGDDAQDFSPSSTPTSLTHAYRSVSRASNWAGPDTPSHHHAGTSYFPHSPPPPPQRHPGGYSMARSLSATSTRGACSQSVSSAQVAGIREDEGEDEEGEGGVSADESGSRRQSRERRRGKAAATPPSPDDDDDDDDDDGPEGTERDEDPITLKERQSIINAEHPFGLPIWKPALYKKSRSVTRHADEALHSVPSAQAERHLLPGNVFWTCVFGWWLALVCFGVAALLWAVPRGGRRFAGLVFGLGWYLAWPFGKYVEGDLEEGPADEERAEGGEEGEYEVQHAPRAGNGVPLSEHSTITVETVRAHPRPTSNESWNPPTEQSSLLPSAPPRSLLRQPSKVYGATTFRTSSSSSGSLKELSDSPTADLLGKVCFWLAFVCIIAPLMLVVCIVCWALVVTIPMARLNWALIKHLFQRPTSIRFCAAPPAVVVASPPLETAETESGTDTPTTPQQPQFAVKHARLSAGQVAPSSPASTVLLCTYRAAGAQYYKYTVGGVNILFVNLLPVVFFVILDGELLLPWVERRAAAGRRVHGALAVLASRALIFVMSLLSVIPLSYFIGMAVASISAQSSIGMGAVINATFGSLIEIILYAMALADGKGRLVEGSIVGSLLAGVLLMPGLSMCSGALRKKEQKFNAKSAGVTSMMLIMAIIGTLGPTLFYQTYGNFQLVCKGCPSAPHEADKPWICDQCYYQHPDPVDDPFYQATVKNLMYFAAAILLFSYLIGLWFSLRTHATQIWQNPQQLMQHPLDMPPAHGQPRISIFNRSAQGSGSQSGQRGTLHRKPSTIRTSGSNAPSRSQTPVPHSTNPGPGTSPTAQRSSGGAQAPPSPAMQRRVSYATSPQPSAAGYAPVLESVDQAIKSTGLQPSQLPERMTTDDFTRAVAVATVSALRHQQTFAHSPARMRASGVSGGAEAEGGGGGHGGHDAPSWSRAVSASVLLSCTFLYALIAEILVDVVDVILEGSGVEEKFLGITLFALVPNTTEFMNAISFAMNGNIALSMEIGSAYALQVCLLQIPAMVAFSAWYAPEKMGRVAYTFTLIFPRWDVVCIMLSVFLMTYTYIEAKSNYHRGSILILSYLVLAAGFYFAPPPQGISEEDVHMIDNKDSLPFLTSASFFLSSFWHR